VDLKESGGSLATLLTIAKAKCHALEYVPEELLDFFDKDMLPRFDLSDSFWKALYRHTDSWDECDADALAAKPACRVPCIRPR
jgi:hypothetical protein